MRFKLLVILLIIAIIGASILTYFYVSYRVVDKKELIMYVTVGNNLGFNTNTDALYFGTLINGGTSSRLVSIKNERCAKCLVRIVNEGDISEWINISENNFLMKEGELKQIKLDLIIPSNIEKGNYSGKLSIYFLKKTI